MFNEEKKLAGLFKCHVDYLHAFIIAEGNCQETNKAVEIAVGVDRMF